MSTTALYVFAINDREQLPFFSPYAGDPLSVARRFLCMQYDKPLNEDYAMRFFRANAELEFAQNHNVASDYIYTLNHQGQLRAAVFQNTGWDVFFKGAIEDFIDQYETLSF